MQERRYDIDWLRVLTIMLVFFFHCARFFGGGPWHLKNPEESFVAHIFIMFLDLWIMPLFFLLSGAGSWYALRTRNGGQYLLVCNSMEYRNGIEISDYCSNLFCLDNDYLRAANKTFQCYAVPFRHETKENRPPNLTKANMLI